MATQKQKLFNFSHGVYNIDSNTTSSLNKSNALNDVVERLFDRPAVLNTVKAFHESPLDVQRDLLDRDPKSIISCFIEVALKMEGNPDVLLIVLPYLDSFLFRSLTRQPHLRPPLRRQPTGRRRLPQVPQPNNPNQRRHFLQTQPRRGCPHLLYHSFRL